MASYKWYKRQNIWDGVYLNHYVVTTDQGTFERDCKWLDYKKTKKNFEEAGYTNVNICHIGKRLATV